MKNIYLALSVFCLVILGAQAAQYAVLVAGSNGYYNYRHQADVFHAYQILIKTGIPAENIITMAYDDIANDPENPFPGQVFNKPALLKKGTDVYAGVKIDYKGADVSPANFLAVLKGDSKAAGGKKVLKSTAQDNVFVYFADHGADGLIAFPNEYLYADDLIKALTYMYDNKMYKEMVLYIEACESGSMFENLLPTNINIYATTAANSVESSWATYCSPNDRVSGKSINSCLGDLYSVNFLENLESIDPSKETLQEQFDIIKKATTKSHVQQFGDLKIAKEVVGNFQGKTKVAKNLNFEEVDKYATLIDSRMNKLAYLRNKYARIDDIPTKHELFDEIYSVNRFDEHFRVVALQFQLNLDAPVGKIDFDCLKARVKMYEKYCGKFTDYGLQYVRYIHHTCAKGIDIYQFERVISSPCLAEKMK